MAPVRADHVSAVVPRRSHPKATHAREGSSWDGHNCAGEEASRVSLDAILILLSCDDCLPP